MIIYCLSYAHDIMIWISRSADLHSDNIITTTTTNLGSTWLAMLFVYLFNLIAIFQRIVTLIVCYCHGYYCIIIIIICSLVLLLLMEIKQQVNVARSELKNIR